MNQLLRRAAAPAVLFLSLVPLHAQSWRVDVDVPFASGQAVFNERGAQGYWMSGVTMRAAPNGDLVLQMLWSSPAPSGGWVAHGGMDSAGYQQLVNQYAQSNIYPVMVDAAGEYPNEHYIAVWRPLQWPAYLARHRMTSAEYQTEFTNQAQAGLRPIWVGATGSGSNARFAAIWARDNRGFAGLHERPLSNLIAELDGWRTGGFLPIAISAYGTPTQPLFAAVSVQDPTPWSYLIDIDQDRLRAELAALARTGGRPLVLEGWETPAGPRYVLVSTQENPAPVFRATGVAHPGLAPLDTAMQNFMQTHGISQGALAVTRNGRLVHARGYTLAPATHETTQPYSRFRIASVTKPLTAVAVLRLVAAGRITLDQKVSTILDMSNWVDPRARDITIRHLLTHFGGFDRGRSGDPMFMDQQVANATGRPLPTTPQMVIDYWSQRMLDFTPGTVDPNTVDSYSNFGYCLLGRVIERVTGLTYEEYLLREVLSPVGAGMVRVGDSLRGMQLPFEADYDAHQPATNVMRPSGGTVEQAYGGFNLRTMDAHGGLVCSVIDLARFVVAFDDRDRSPLLSRGLIDAMWARPPQVTGTPATWYAMGWAVRDVGGGNVNAWHTGSLPGTYSEIVRRADGIDWVVLFNKTGPNLPQIDQVVNVAIAQVTNWPQHDLFETLPAVRSLGAGCPSSSGLAPGLQTQPGATLLPASRLIAQMSRLPNVANSLAAVFVGTSSTSYGGVPLPLRLSFLGAPACTLYVAPDVTFPVAPQAPWLTLDLPNQPELIGGTLFLQGLVTDPGANALGIAFTPGMAMQLGQR